MVEDRRKIKYFDTHELEAIGDGFSCGQWSFFGDFAHINEDYECDHHFNIYDCIDFYRAFYAWVMSDAKRYSIFSAQMRKRKDADEAVTE